MHPNLKFLSKLGSSPVISDKVKYVVRFIKINTTHDVSQKYITFTSKSEIGNSLFLEIKIKCTWQNDFQEDGLPLSI